MKMNPKIFTRMSAMLIVLSIFLLVLAPFTITLTSAEVTELNVPPWVVQGETLSISGKASANEVVWIGSSFELSLPVSDGKYCREFNGIHFPAGEKVFSVTAENIKNIRISISPVPVLGTVEYPLEGPKNATNGVATLSVSFPAEIYGFEIDIHGKKDVKVYGDAADGATSVNLKTEVSIKVTANPNGDFALDISTEGVPLGEFLITAGGIEKTVEVVLAEPTPTPPTAYIDSITPDPAEQGTDTVSFTGHGTDSDGSVDAYNWRSSIDSQLSTFSSFTKSASELSVGTHTIYFKVQDNDGAWSSEDTEELCINGLWEDDPDNPCKERRGTCSGTYEYRNKPDGTDCGSDYYEDWASYCKGDEVWKHRRFHDFYCDGGTCTGHTSWVDDQLVENCNDYDGWHCNGDVRENRDYYCSGGSCTYTVTSSENCNDYDGWMDTGDTRWIDEPGNECKEEEQKKQEYRDYACSGGSCTYSVTNTQWIDTGNTRNKSDGTICGYENWGDNPANECKERREIKKCMGGTCTRSGEYEYRNKPDGTDCGSDGWVDTVEKKWIDEPGNECTEKEQKKQEYLDYACSGGSCTYSVTNTQWIDTGNTRNKSDGTYCGCTANNTLKKCCGGTCSDTGICNSTYCGADSACDGKKTGDTCDANKNCNSTCKCITSLDVTTVSIGSGSAEANDTATIALMINVSIVDAPSGLGNATINLTYNPNVVNVTSVKNSNFDSFVYNTNNSSGLTRIVAYQTGATGLIGNIKFADIEFKAVGERGDVSPLNLEVIELRDNNGGPIPHVVKNGSFIILDGELNPFDTGLPENPYPSIGGIHNGTIKPNKTIRVHKLYTYPCPGTGGHTEYVRIENNSGWNVTARWNGYGGGDWRNITFEESFTLQPGVEYNYTIMTGSYPQIIHQHEANVTGGTITCTEFIDANGKIYREDWIPAIILSYNFYQGHR